MADDAGLDAMRCMFDINQPKEEIQLSFGLVEVKLLAADEDPGFLQSGIFLWPAAEALCHYLCALPSLPSRILELGAGAGLCGIVCSKLLQQQENISTEEGAFVLMTDRDAASVDLIASNIERNGIGEDNLARANELVWGSAESIHSVIADAQFQLLIGSDLVYSVQAAQLLLKTVAMVLRTANETDDGGSFVLCSSFRHPETSAAIENICNSLGLKREVVRNGLLSNADEVCCDDAVDITHSSKDNVLLERFTLCNSQMNVLNHDEVVCVASKSTENVDSEIANFMHAQQSCDVSKSLGKARRALRRQHLGLLHRLRSIDFDSNFVSRISSSPGLSRLPLFANLRCGSWYVDPRGQNSFLARFKSDDGHPGNWRFVPSRANLNVAHAAAHSGACILVDSTRSGKRFPDSFSRTVPLWCAVLNYAIGLRRSADGNPSSWDSTVNLPPWISPSERDQINVRVEVWARMLDAPTLLNKLDTSLCYPLRAVWLRPVKTKSEEWACEFVCPHKSKLILHDDEVRSGALETMLNVLSKDYTVVICLSCSCTDAPEEYYVQGAGDDEENWSCGITPRLFWEHRSCLLNAVSNEECAEIASKIVFNSTQLSSNSLKISDVSPPFISAIEGTGLCVGDISVARWCIACSAELVKQAYNIRLLIDCTPHTHTQTTSVLREERDTIAYLRIPLSFDKRGSRKGNERAFWQNTVLPCVLDTYYDVMYQKRNADGNVLVCCQDGTGSSLAVALALLLVFFTKDQLLRSTPAETVIKADVRKRMLLLPNSGALPRRLVKELTTFFGGDSYTNWRCEKKNEAFFVSSSLTNGKID